MKHYKPLEGIKILDFTWVIAGPLATKCLADYGATVIKIESVARPDVHRITAPAFENKPGVNRGVAFIMYNSNKLSLSLNFKLPKGREIAHRLADWSDVVIDNFMPGTLEKVELGYEDLRRTNPDIIMVRSTMQGHTGPHANVSSYGIHLAALAGITDLIGWPNQPPVGPPSSYPDFIAPWYTAVAILAALEYRDRTGRGLSIDLSQLESTLFFMAPALLDYTVNGRIAKRDGNRSPRAAPHGCFRCKGDDRWCVISVSSDEEWQALTQVLGHPSWCQDARFNSFKARKENEDELERLIEEWTLSHTAEEVMELLQTVGLPGGVVKDGRDLRNDPQLNHRSHFVTLNHSELGPCMHETHSFKLSRSAPETKAAPCLGEHNEYICCEILGMSDKEFIGLLESGVLR